MSDMAKQARAAMKAKASKLTSADPHQKVDSSTWTPAEPLNTEVKTGLRPISRRAFKKGGKVMGQKPKANLGKATRGGNKPLTPDNFANKDVKAANEDRAGLKHVGALKRGGKAIRKGRDEGGKVDEIGAFLKKDTMPFPKPEPKQPSDNTPDVTPAQAERMRTQGTMKPPARAHGGKAKKAGGGPLAGAQAMMKKAQQTAGVPASTLDSVPATSRMSKAAGLKKGGAAKHDDVKQDMALIKKMVKPEARKGKAIGGAFGEFLSPALMLANAVRGDDKKRGGKAMRKGREDGGGAYSDEGFDAAESARAANMLYDASRRGKDRITMTPNDYENMVREIGENIAHSDAAYDQERYRKNGGKAKRTARKEGGGVFTGPGYPGKIPGVVPGGREARATGGKTKGKGKTNINIIVAAGKPAGEQDMMNPMGAPTRPPGLPVAVPPPQGAAPMPAGMPMPMPPAPAPGPAAGPMPMPRKSGGRLTAKASSYKDMTAGSGGGEGRLQKTDIAEKHKDAPAFKKGGKVYRSYKDMDAGSGSGMGRLEKTEIQSHKR